MTISRDRNTGLLIITPDVQDMNWYKECTRKRCLDLANKTLKRLEQKLKEQQ